MWVYFKTGDKWSVGFFTNDEQVWHEESVWDSAALARSRVHYLNGGNDDMVRGS